MKGLTVILAAGEFPRKGGEPWRLLVAAERVIACDAAAVDFKRYFHRWPDVVIGDLDSMPASWARCSHRVVRDDDPSTNDLSKAIAYCRAQGWSDPVVVGATGKREDHTIGNVYRGLEAGVRMVTETGEFIPFGGKDRNEATVRIKTWKNAGISIFASDLRTNMVSRGLRWKLDGVRFANPYCATLNRAASENVAVTSDRSAYLYVERNPKAVRAVVSLGSNLGDRAAYLRRAVKALASLPQTRLVAKSEEIETEGVEVPDEFASLRFLNQVALFETTLQPLSFSRAMHAIEDRLGRIRTVKNGPRTIDLDLVAFGAVRRATPELTLPHPRAHERAFVREPMASLGLGVP